MKNVMLAAAFSALAMFAQPAIAAESISNGTINFNNTQGNLTLNGTFQATKTELGTFTDLFFFDVGQLFSGQLFTGTIVVKTDATSGSGKNLTNIGDIDLGPIFINGTAIARTSSSKDLTSETFTITDVLLSQGMNRISVGGNVNTLVGGKAQYNGSVSLSAAGAVPEPATWAMMLFGFGAVGYSMRSRKVGYKGLQLQAA